MKCSQRRWEYLRDVRFPQLFDIGIGCLCRIVRAIECWWKDQLSLVSNGCLYNSQTPQLQQRLRVKVKSGGEYLLESQSSLKSKTFWQHLVYLFWQEIHPEDIWEFQSFQHSRPGWLIEVTHSTKLLFPSLQSSK